MPTLRVMTLPSAHIEAAHRVKKKPARVMLWSLFCMAISASPQPATTSPPRCDSRKRSPRKATARIRVKKACDCSTSDARPAGMPTDMAWKRKANCPTEMVMP